jgi:hypothetical protein
VNASAAGTECFGFPAIDAIAASKCAHRERPAIA